jgi:hypothetical protein
MRPFLDTAGRMLREHWGAALLLLVAAGLHFELFLSVPATGDHMIHLYKGWLMAEHTLPSGRITGWSNMAFAGYPAGVYYPILGDLLITLTRWLTCGLLSWERTYAVFFLLITLSIPLVVYGLTRRATGGNLGPLVAGLLAAGDVGGWPQGGHVSTVHWAVWPFILSMLLGMLAVLACEGAVLQAPRERPGRFLLFVLLAALAALAHPMSAFFLGLAAPLFVLMLAAAERRGVGTRPVIERSALAAALALVLAGFWLVPWLTTGNTWTLGWPAVGFGGMWFSLPRMLEALALNKLFYDFYPATWALGLCGFLLALISRRRWPTYLALLLVVVILFAGLANALGDGTMARRVQIERLAAFMKLLWFVLAGYAVFQAGEGLDWLQRRLPAAWRSGKRLKACRALRVAAGALVVVALVLGGWTDHFSKTLKVGRLGGELWGDIVRTYDWLATQPRGPLDRVLYQPGDLCLEGKLTSEKCNEVYHRHIFASSPVHTDLPKIKFGYEATAIFRNMPLAHRWPHDTELIRDLLTRPEALESLHVRWIVSLAEWTGREDVREERRFGDVIVYSVEAGKGPPVRIEGEGRIAVERFEDEYVRVRVEGAGPRSRLLFPVAFFYPWKAYHDGAPLPMERHGVLPHVRQILMATAARDGVVELRYERPWWERAANWTSLAGWLGVIGVAIFLGRRRLRRKRSA